MCRVFVDADPSLYACRVRSMRLHGVAASVRLENLFWNVLADIARRDPAFGGPPACAGRSTLARRAGLA